MTSAIIYYGFRISFSDFWNLTKEQVEKLDEDMFDEIENDIDLVNEYIDNILNILKIKNNKKIKIIEVDWETKTSDKFSKKSHFIFGVPISEGKGTTDFSLSVEKNKNKDIKKTMKTFKKNPVFKNMKLDYIAYIKDGWN